MISYECAERIFKSCSLEYNKFIHEKFSTYFEFLVEYNNNVNLTAITDPEQVWLKHFADSILLLKNVEITQNSKMIDVGTGAGFPSIPVKIYRDDIKLTLLDSLNKRIIFLEKLCEKLDIEAEKIHGRAEEIGKKEEYRERFDIASARAVAAMPVLCEYCMPLVKKGGVFAAMKGPNEESDAAVKAVKILGGDSIKVNEYTLGNEDKRKIFVVKKISQTPTKYPRNSGQIKNKPL